MVSLSRDPRPWWSGRLALASEFHAEAENRYEWGSLMATLLDFALNYIARGWRPIPIPHGQKAPILPGWNQLEITAETAAQHFNCAQQNIGVRLGEPSGWLIDIDLDCEEAIRLAPGILPSTLRFGREGRPGSHWLYRSEGLAGKAFRIPGTDGGDPATICEIRSTRQQTVFPPSTHPSGQAIRFETREQPLAVSAEVLTAKVGDLATACVLSRYNAENADALPPEIRAAVREWFAPKPAIQRLAPSGPTGPDGHSAVAEAVRRYNTDHRREWPRSGAQCPFCGHNDCFGHLPDAPEVWCCFSAAHSGAGIAKDNIHVGDALDADIFGKGISRIEHLRATGYLGPVGEQTEDPPDDDTPHSIETGAAPVYEGSTRGVGDRPIITYLCGRGHDAVADALPPLADCTRVYQRGQKLVTVTRTGQDTEPSCDDISREPAAPIISPISRGYLWEILSSCIEWTKPDGRKKGLRTCEPPSAVVDALHGRSIWPGIPELRGIATTPILRGDGTLRCQAGFDRETGLYLMPSCRVPEVKDAPTQIDAACAVRELLDVVADFPFVKDCYRTVWVSMVLSRVGWGAFYGGAPLVLIDASTAGTGKTLASDAASVIATGTSAARSPFVDNDDELRKRITSHLMAGDQIAMIDNVPAGFRIGWPSLDNALTATIWADRELGKNVVTRIPMDTMWIVTGNNLAVRGDAARRTLRIRMEAQQERPELRTGFTHEPLIPWVRKERPRLLASALVVLRAYLLAGRPDVGVSLLGSFEGWSGLVRNALIWAGQPDPVEALANNDVDVDPEADAHAQLLANWGELDDLSDDGGLTCSQILGQCGQRGDELAGLIDAISVLCPTKDGGLPTPRKLGEMLRGVVGRIREVEPGKNKRLAKRRGCHANVARWWVETLKQ